MVGEATTKKEMLEKLYNQIADLPIINPKTPDPLTGAPPGQVRCACGKKFIPMSDINYHQTSLVMSASDTECRECLPAHKNFALIVCLKCRAVVAKMAPTQFPGGFRMAANWCYHVAQCPTCCPGIKTSSVLEKYVYDKARGYPVPDAQIVLSENLTNELP